MQPQLPLEPVDSPTPPEPAAPPAVPPDEGTDWARAALAGLARCTLQPASFEKRAVRQWGASSGPLSAKQVAIVERLAHKYRRQLGSCPVPNCAACAKGRKR